VPVMLAKPFDNAVDAVSRFQSLTGIHERAQFQQLAAVGKRKDA
jgi:hypothetical protein